MGSEMKQEKMTQTQGTKYFRQSILLCLLNIGIFVIPVTGFSLRSCRITNDNNAVCANNKLRAVPKDIPLTVRTLDLSNNRIKKIGGLDFKELRHLIKLDLKQNHISQLDNGTFISLNSLKVLNLNNNHLVKLQDNLFLGLSNLTELRLINNRIKTVESSSFKPLTSLRFLDLANNDLRHLTNVQRILQHLPNLEDFSVRSNDLSTFQSWELSNSSIELASLDLSHNQIEVFRVTADIFPNLKRLNLGDIGKKHHVKWEMRNMTWLRLVSSLDISGLHLSFVDMKTLLEGVNSSLTHLRMNSMKNELEALVKVSCTIPTMSMLQLRNNGLKVITSDLFQLCVNVTELDLAANHIRDISSNSFTALKWLKILNLGGSNLSFVPAATRNLPTLIELDLSSNNISTLGCYDFANLTKLRELSLYQNSISSLKECVFKDLINLQILMLQTNHISRLNNAFKSSLPNLKILHLNKNELSAIACEEFEGLQSLQNLSLHENQIKTLENGAFKGLGNLIYIQLMHNELEASEIKAGVFKDLKNLRQLDISSNHIHYTKTPLPNPPFSELSHLETLDISTQRHKFGLHIPQNFLQGLSNLLRFSIKDIHLKSLYINTFNYTPQLRILDVNSNDLTDIPPALFSPIQNLESLYISRTNLGSLDFLTKANLTTLKFLQARTNAFSVISETVIQSLPALVYLDLKGNSFTCDCDNAWFLQWVEDNNQTQVNDAYNFQCNYPHDLKGMKLLDLDVHSCSVDTGFICFISTTCAVLLFLTTSFTYHFLRWQLVYAYYFFLALLFDTKQKNKQAPNQYDAFISYNIHDEPWVITELVPKLEGEQGWRLCLHHRDFQPGKPIIDNITDSIYGSRKTICVISRRYLESEWCSREIQLASFRLFDEKKDVLILVFLDEIPTSQLSPYYRMRRLLKSRSYLSWPRAEEHTELFWEKLRQALKTREEPSQDSAEDMLLLTVQE